ncbi:MAG: OmpA family protein, partial [Bdellovibrionaceae bacterium]|nr:OmpA family protein [Pseudobdellovibrionaceae bacterium]
MFFVKENRLLKFSRYFSKHLSFAIFSIVFASQAHANILGNMQTFSPSPDSLFFENIHASKTLKKNHFNLGFFTSYVRNELSVYDNLGTQNFVNYKDSAITFDFVAAWGVTNSFELFYALPGFINQKPDSGQFQNNFVTDGVNTHRPGFKYDISQSNEGGFAFVGSVDFPVTENDPYTGTDADPIYNLELVYDVRNKATAYGFNLGYRIRSPGAIPLNSPYFFPLQDQLIYSFGYVTALNTNHRYHFELYGATAADKDPHDKLKHVSALEGLIAFKQRLHKGLWGHLGGTAELLPQGLAPQFRLYAGVNWFFGLDSKKSDPVSSEPLSVTPSEIELEPNGSSVVDVAGGAKPYKYSLTNNFGRFDSKKMTYFAPSSKGTTELAVEDATGTRVLVPIRVGIAEETEASPLVTDPTSVDMYEGAETGIGVSGGVEPYSYRLSQPFGEFDSSSMTYFAPATPGTVDLIVTDAVGQRKLIPIRVAAVPKANREFVIKNLQFKFNSDELTEKSKKILDTNVKKLEGEKISRIIVAGHTDNIGADVYNLQLSRKRAKAVGLVL